MYEKVLQSMTLLTKLLWVQGCPRANFFIAEVEFSEIQSQRDLLRIELHSSNLLEGRFEKFQCVWAGEV